MNRSNSAMTDGDHSPMRKQLVLFQSQSGSLSVLKSPTKRSDVLHARHGVDENSKRGKQPARNESDETRILRSQVEQYQQQLRFLERESAEHRSAAIKTRERALQLLKTYDQMTQLANKEQGTDPLKKVELTKLIDQIVFSANQNTTTYTKLDQHLKSMSSSMRGLVNGDFKRRNNTNKENVAGDSGSESSSDDDVPPMAASEVNDSMVKAEATTSSMLRLSKHIMQIAKKCIEERSFMIPQEELEQQMSVLRAKLNGQLKTIQKKHEIHLREIVEMNAKKKEMDNKMIEKLCKISGTDSLWTDNEIIKEFTNIDISKQFQSSDFGGELTPAQLKYCANDVVYLHKIHEELNKILIRENRVNLYIDCLKFLKTRVDLDLALFKDDIWSH